MTISRKELNPHNYPETPEISVNLDKLLECINKVRTGYGKPMTITSGLRDIQDQARINPTAPKSKHLVGAACDIKDSDGKLFSWCQQNETFLKECGIKGIELGTVGWVHFQVLPVKSGKFFFKP